MYGAPSMKPRWKQPELELPLRALARATDPQTSKDAALRVDPEGLAAIVLTELRKMPGTSHELAQRLAMSLVTVSPRMKPLEDRGFVKRAGKREGRTIWEAIP